MFFSIITPTFNSEKYLKKHIASLNRQKYTFEQIFIDNLSSDSTLKIIKDNAKYPHTIISEKDLGIYYAMNKGIEKAKGNFLLFLNSDDWMPDKTLETVQKKIKKNTNYNIYYGNTNFYKNNIFKFSCKSDIKKIFQVNSISHQATYYSKEVFSNYKYDTKYLVASDYDLSIKLVKKNYKFFYIDKTLSNNSLGGYSSNLVRSFNDFFDIQKKNNGIRGYVNTIIEYKLRLVTILFKKICKRKSS